MFEVSTTSFYTNVDERQLVAERAKFAKHVMVSVGVCFSEKGNCISFQTRPKWMLNFMLKPCCQNLFNIADLFYHPASSFNRTAKLAQDWITTNCSEFIGKDEWPPNSPDLNPLDYLNATSQQIQLKPEIIDELKKVLQLIWDQLPQDSIKKTILSFPKRLRACVKAGGGHFEHTLKWTTCQILVFVITVNVSRQWKLQVAVDYFRIVAGSLPYKSRNLGIKTVVEKFKCILSGGVF